AADDVGADDAIAVLQPPRQHIEVATLTRDAVGADEDAVARAAGALPLPVRHAVQAAGVETLDAAQRRLVRRAHFICTVPLTWAETSALPGSTGSGSAAMPTACACIRIIGCGPGIGSLVCTLTSR